MTTNAENPPNTTTVRLCWRTYRALAELAGATKTAEFPDGMPLGLRLELGIVLLAVIGGGAVLAGLVNLLRHLLKG